MAKITFSACLHGMKPDTAEDATELARLAGAIKPTATATENPETGDYEVDEEDWTATTDHAEGTYDHEGTPLGIDIRRQR